MASGVDSTGAEGARTIKVTTRFDRSSASDTDEVIAGHIHKGTADVAGDVVVLLFEDTAGLAGTGSYEGCTKGVKKKLIKKFGKKPDRYYVNIHTKEFPDGAIRGQLEPVK